MLVTVTSRLSLADNFYGTFRLWSTSTRVAWHQNNIDNNKKKPKSRAITISNNDDNGMWKCSNSLNVAFFSFLSLSRRQPTSNNDKVYAKISVLMDLVIWWIGFKNIFLLSAVVFHFYQIYFRFFVCICNWSFCSSMLKKNTPNSIKNRKDIYETARQKNKIFAKKQ